MAQTKGSAVSVRFQAEVMTAIQTWIDGQPGAVTPSRSQAIDHIIKQALVDRWSRPCVCVGYAKGELQFIGAYKNPLQWSHLAPKRSGIDDWQSIPCEPAQIDPLVEFLIKLLEPPLNDAITENDDSYNMVFITAEQYRFMFGKVFEQNPSRIDHTPQEIVNEFLNAEIDADLEFQQEFAPSPQM